MYEGAWNSSFGISVCLCSLKHELERAELTGADSGNPPQCSAVRELLRFFLFFIPASLGKQREESSEARRQELGLVPLLFK